MGVLYRRFMEEAAPVKNEQDTEAIGNNYELLYKLIASAPGRNDESTLAYRRFTLEYPESRISGTKHRDGSIEIAIIEYTGTEQPPRPIPYMRFVALLQNF